MQWKYERQMLSSPPIKDKKTYKLYKQLITRSWIQAEFNESQHIIRISLNPSDARGKFNAEKLEKLQIIF